MAEWGRAAERIGPIKVMVVDDHPSVRERLGEWIADAADLELAGLAADAATALRLAREERPDIVLLDIQIPGLDPEHLPPGVRPGEQGGVQVTRALRARFPAVRIIWITGFGYARHAQALAKLRVDACLTKSASSREVVEAVRAVMRGRRLIAPEVTRELAEAKELLPDMPLTGKEELVLQGIADGLRNDAIGARMGISAEGVHFHQKSLFAKFRVTTRTELVVRVFKLGWFE